MPEPTLSLPEALAALKALLDDSDGELKSRPAARRKALDLHAALSRCRPGQPLPASTAALLAAFLKEQLDSEIDEQARRTAAADRDKGPHANELRAAHHATSAALEQARRSVASLTPAATAQELAAAAVPVENANAAAELAIGRAAAAKVFGALPSKPGARRP